MTPTAAQLTRLRKMIDESGTSRFTDAELTSVCSEVSNIYFAAAECWAEKAGMMQREMGAIEADSYGEEAIRFTALTARLNYAMRMSEHYTTMGKRNIGGIMLDIKPPTVIYVGDDAVEG